MAWGAMAAGVGASATGYCGCGALGAGVGICAEAAATGRILPEAYDVGTRSARCVGTGRGVNGCDEAVCAMR